MRFLLCLLLLSFAPLLRAEDPLLKPNDVVALLGGEDMVVASELGYLEAFVQMALPDYKLKFRSLAWEGDTVFEQRRDLNYPPLEAQLDRIGATVVIAQFGATESLAGKAKVQEFKDAYQKLIARLNSGGKRRVLLVEPTPRLTSGKPTTEAVSYGHGVEAVSPNRDGYLEIWYSERERADGEPWDRTILRADGIHLSEAGHSSFAQSLLLGLLVDSYDLGLELGAKGVKEKYEALRKTVVAKNRHWFNYSRPQNWAFLAGDRTNQPSSRDHIDRNKRWFPEELEKFVPLIEAKEKEIWELAAKFKP